MKKESAIFIIVLTIIVLLTIIGYILTNIKTVTIQKVDKIVEGTWQAEVKFPDWKGYIDDTLAMNSMYSFDGYEDQGKLYFTVGEKVESFDLFINNKKVNTKKMKNGIYEVDISKIAKNGTNTIQVSNIMPTDLKEAITVNIPYPTIIEGNLNDVRIKKRTI